MQSSNIIDLSAFRRHGRIEPLPSPTERTRAATERKAAAIQTAMSALEAALEELLVASDALAHAGDLRFRTVDKLSERVAEQLHATVRSGGVKGSGDGSG